MGLTGGGGARCVHRVKGDGHTYTRTRAHFRGYAPSMFLCTGIEQDGCIQSVAKIFLRSCARDFLRFFGDDNCVFSSLFSSLLIESFESFDISIIFFFFKYLSRIS